MNENASQSATGQDGPTTTTSGYSKVNGLNMYYEIRGHGQPLVLIHGGGSTIFTSFGRIVPALSRHYQVIAVELQGHGHTPDLERPESFDQDADDVAGLMKNLNVNQADFLGFSNGGNTTLKIAMKYPEIVRKLIIVSAFYKREGMTAGFFDGMKKATLMDMPPQLQEAYNKVAPDTSHLINMFEKDRSRMINFVDWRDEDLRSIQANSLILSGDHDVVRPEHAVEMYRLLPHAELAIFPGVHGQCIGEITTLSGRQKDSILALPLILDFLNE